AQNEPSCLFSCLRVKIFRLFVPTTMKKTTTVGTYVVDNTTKNSLEVKELDGYESHCSATSVEGRVLVVGPIQQIPQRKGSAGLLCFRRSSLQYQRKCE